jgi:hypothetical protein
MPEQWRGDALSCLGHPALRTPNFDRMIEDGYDLRNDPREETNLLYSDPEAHTAKRCELRDRLLEWYAKTSGVVSPRKDLFNHLRPQAG